MKRIFLTLSLIPLCIVGCLKDPAVIASSNGTQPFSTGETTDAFLRFIDSGLVNTISWSGFLDKKQYIDLEQDGNPDLAFTLWISNSPGQRNTIRTVSGIECEIAYRKREFFSHESDTIVYSGNDTILVHRIIWDENKLAATDSKMFFDLPVLDKGVGIDTISTWGNGSTLEKDTWTAGSGLTWVGPNHAITTSITQLPPMVWGNAIYTYIPIRKKVSNNYHYGWILMDKKFKILGTALQK